VGWKISSSQGAVFYSWEGKYMSDVALAMHHRRLCEIRNLHISKIRFLFPVSFTTEYKVGIVEFYLYMGFGADLLKNVVTRA